MKVTKSNTLFLYVYLKPNINHKDEGNDKTHMTVNKNNIASLISLHTIQASEHFDDDIACH
jgi:hypothetical protein